MGSTGGLRADPALSVVIPCRNGAAVLPRQLGALAAQEWAEPWEVIVVDNASSDATAAVAARWADRLPSLRVLRASRRGRQHACNVGARAAPRAAVFVDADDEVAPGFVRVVGEALGRHPIVVVAAEAAGGGGPQSAGLRDELGFLAWGQGGTIGVQRHVFDALGGFGESMRYAEDVDFCWRAQLAGYALQFLPEAKVRWYPRPSLRGTWRQYRNYGRGQAMLYRRYRDHGMPRRPARRALGEWVGLMRSAPMLRTEAERSRWVRRLARDVGRLQGSLRYGVWYP